MSAREGDRPVQSSVPLDVHTCITAIFPDLIDHVGFVREVKLPMRDDLFQPVRQQLPAHINSVETRD